MAKPTSTPINSLKHPDKGVNIPTEEPRDSITRDEAAPQSQRLRLDLPRDALAEFCRRNPIRRLSVFGSALRDDFTSESDLDLLVEFQPDAGVGLFRLAELEEELTRLVGRKVDLNTPMSLNPAYRDGVVADAETVYASA